MNALLLKLISLLFPGVWKPGDAEISASADNIMEIATNSPAQFASLSESPPATVPTAAPKKFTLTARPSRVNGKVKKVRFTTRCGGQLTARVISRNENEVTLSRRGGPRFVRTLTA